MTDFPREAYVASAAGERLFTVGVEEQVRADNSTLALAEFFAETLPGRVLAECEAKRRIIGSHPHRVDADDVVLCCETCTGYTGGHCPTTRALGLPYSDHPDYLEEWRP
ncbi:MAG: hypothetical protein HOV78_11330 [Hamadaea sp.]|nr:hypothetical protein [Hamadaea sp.]